MREKRRYLLIEVISERKFSEEDAKRAAYEAVFQLLGEQGASKAAMQAKAYDPERQLLLLKCSLASHRNVVAALALKAGFGGARISLRLRKIYGTLKKAKSLFPTLKRPKG